MINVKIKKWFFNFPKNPVFFGTYFTTYSQHYCCAYWKQKLLTICRVLP